MTTPPASTALARIAFGDLEQELATTRRVLERLPEGHFAWKPHEKSMSLGQLAFHVVTLLHWQKAIIEGDSFDLASAPPPVLTTPATRAELLSAFEERSAGLREAMARLDDSALDQPWTLRRGDQVIFRQSRAEFLRRMGISHMLHHRGQLCVYLRLLGVPVPAVYGPSADEPTF